jgi:hypothetical protein
LGLTSFRKRRGIRRGRRRRRPESRSLRAA